MFAGHRDEARLPRGMPVADSVTVDRRCGDFAKSGLALIFPCPTVVYPPLIGRPVLMLGADLKAAKLTWFRHIAYL